MARTGHNCGNDHKTLLDNPRLKLLAPCFLIFRASHLFYMLKLWSGGGGGTEGSMGNIFSRTFASSLSFPLISSLLDYIKASGQAD